jgi:hypothetical protein
VVEVFRAALAGEFWGAVDCPDGIKVCKIFSAGQTEAEDCPALTSAQDVGKALQREYNSAVARKRSNHLEKQPNRGFKGVLSVALLEAALKVKEDYAASRRQGGGCEAGDGPGEGPMEVDDPGAAAG